MHRIFVGLLSLTLLLAPASIYAEGQQSAAAKQAFVFDVENSSTGKTEELTVNANLMEVKSPKIPKTTFINDGKNSGPFKGIRNNAVVFFSNGEGTCSGAMIGPYTVLTARHCVFLNGPIKSLTNKLNPTSHFVVKPGGYDSGITVGVSYIITPKIPSQFIGFTNSIYAVYLVDYSILVLEKPVGSQTGWFNVAKRSVSMGEPIVVMGFPGDKQKFHPWLSKGKVVELAPGSALSLFERVFGNPYPYLPFNHNAKFLPGISGGPVFSEQKGKDTIIGVASTLFGPSPDNALFSIASRGGMVDFVNKYRYATPHDVKLQMQQIIQQNFPLAK